MTLSVGDVAHVLLGLALLLSMSQALGFAFARFRQPRVIGEIVGGLVLGPTVFGALAPGVQQQVFPSSGATPLVLDAVYQLGLLLLMFSSGAEVRSQFHRGETKTVAFTTLAGTLLPFLAGLALLAAFPADDFRGPAGDNASFVLVFGIAVAVTSIPVISRIMLDLGILETAFARIVLAVAVIEDIVLYVLLAIALGLAAGTSAETFGLPALLGIDPGSVANVAYHVAATVGFLAISLVLGPPAYRSVLHLRYNVVKRGSPIAFQLVFMFAVTVLALFLGVVPLFGAFVAGIVVGSSSGEGAAKARESIKTFSFAFFIPVYFAIVGLRLDLVRDLAPLFTIGFIAFACVAKSLSVFVGARAAGETRAAATNLSIALNARGGPGIVLASVALDAAIIDRRFYVTLVLLAILTSLAAGSWLERTVRSGRVLR